MGARYLIFFLALTAASCGWTINMKPRGVDGSTLTPSEKEEWGERFRYDRAVCWEKGAAHQTYSGSSYFYEGTGGGSGRSEFNSGVYVTCMEAAWRAVDLQHDPPVGWGVGPGEHAGRQAQRLRLSVLRALAGPSPRRTQRVGRHRGGGRERRRRPRARVPALLGGSRTPSPDGLRSR